jgi:hypothetical protein
MIQTDTRPARAARLRREEAATAFDRDGFLIMPDLLDPALLASARAETVAICRGERGDFDGVVPADRQEDDDDVLRRYLCTTSRTRSRRVPAISRPSPRRSTC